MKQPAPEKYQKVSRAPEVLMRILILAGMLAAPLVSAQTLNEQILYEIRAIHADQAIMRAEQIEHGKQIAVNTDRLGKLERRIDSSEGIRNGERITVLEDQFRNREAQQKAQKDADTADHERLLRRIDNTTGALLAATLAVLGNLFLGWRRGKQHSAEIAAVERQATAAMQTNTEELLKLAKSIDVETKRSDSCQSAQERRLDKHQDQIEALEREEAKS